MILAGVKRMAEFDDYDSRWGDRSRRHWFRSLICRALAAILLVLFVAALLIFWMLTHPIEVIYG
jgi:hypothetical protein